ncbi:hypothetical protein SAMN02745196_02514 [Clostridium collagenovorans DSM 3089]|uniref:Uncharacterized protein n=1 Tax=Clostridium collagenovorans DSM 3089 TaxID=1121306 RepID=A0A1M5XXN5_9CLOT|nr:hypothetical protein [Clostridium collagenovorans]SHI04591.1 hypothetical protein SAMN02745196_02514 [Clostridium collagenovorans DSM 3089]
MTNSKNSASLMAYGAILTALSIVSLYLSTIIPVNTIFFLGIASCLIPLGVMLTNISTGIIIYLAVTCIAFFLIPDKSIVMFYGFFFGLYGVVKYFVEKINKPVIELILKFLFFNLSFGIMYFIYTTLFTKLVSSVLPIYLLIILAQVGFLAFDYIMTLFVAYSNKNILPKLRKMK